MEERNGHSSANIIKGFVNKVYYVIIFLFTAMAYAILLTMDNVLFESTAYAAWSRLGETELMRTYFEDTGHPSAYWYFRAVFAFPSFVFVHKLLVWLSISISACFIYGLLRNLRYFHDQLNMIIALLTVTFPVYSHHSEFYRWPHTIGFLAFWAACWLHSSHIEKRSKIQFFGSLILFIIAFRAPSTLIYCYAYLTALFFSQHTLESIRFKIAPFIQKHYILILLPALDYLTMAHFFPASGWYANYNSIQFDWTTLKFLIFSCFGIFIESWVWTLDFLISDPYSAILIAIYALILILCLTRIWRDTMARYMPNVSKKNWLFGLATGMALFITAQIPFILTQKFSLGVEVGSRNAFLAGLPVAIIIVTLTHLFFGKRKSWAIHTCWMFLFVFVFMSIERQLSLQNHFIKIQSIGELINSKGPPNSKIYLFSDRVNIGMKRKINPIELKLQLGQHCALDDCYAGYIEPFKLFNPFQQGRILAILRESLREPKKWTEAMGSEHLDPRQTVISTIKKLNNRFMYKGDSLFMTNNYLFNQRGHKEVNISKNWPGSSAVVIELNQSTPISSIELWWKYLTNRDKQEVASHFMNVNYNIVEL